ncbi:EF-hand family protein [Tritrichomonas foetus]|uniref:EF-hand family protein n=1 Tax=Tritrichomonas foetus TaxID=1144522 RepID=A0A1J4J830_9EUKA|nr:EF-hand family protein [Tritrichomonas foetus]|eukprot:OHS94833.1 EF-hand family protein [Tritrichomonas foetus]
MSEGEAPQAEQPEEQAQAEVQQIDTSKPHPLSEAEKENVRRLVLKYDKSGNGHLDFDEFVQFCKVGLFADLANLDTDHLPEGRDVNLEQLRFLYDGMDMDGSHSLDSNEIGECLAAMREGNFKWMTKMIFRGADKDNSRKVSISELQVACNGLGDVSFSPEEFKEKCKLELGSEKKEIEYWEFYKIITGETIDKETDPYDGKLPVEKSKCCLLI